jgi:hypothetical protein
MIDASLEGYEFFLRDVKARIQQTQVRAALAVNRELVGLYWQLGAGHHRGAIALRVG